MAISKYDLDKVNSLIGKTITDITLSEEWNGRGDIDSINIMFDDGSSLYINGMNGARCRECPRGGKSGDATLSLSIS